VKTRGYSEVQVFRILQEVDSGTPVIDAVLSGSMEPALPLGGVVFIKPVEPTDIGPGSIIAYRSGEPLITHRVVDVIDESELSFITKGDANQSPDLSPDLSPVPAASVVGKVIFDVPYLGYLAAFVKTPLGFLLAIFLPGLAIIGLELKNMWQVVLKKETARASPQAESKAAPPKLETRQVYSKFNIFGQLSLKDRIAVGVGIGAAATIIVIATLLLTE